MDTSKDRLLRLACLFAALLLLPVLPAFAAAKAPGVRIVRLSVAQGDVQIDRNSGDGWEQAINNMPLIGGAKLYAGENSRAEIEFEDGSSVRLAGPAQIALTELAFGPKGAPVTHVEIDSGIVYVNARLGDNSEFQLISATGEIFNVTHPSRLRFKGGEQVASISVMEGQVEVQKESGNSKINAGETYNYLLGQPDSAVRQLAVTSNPDDSWNQERDAYNQQNVGPVPEGADANGVDENAPGAADLNAYGQYQDVPGYGEVWQPDDVGPDWSPFDYGAWSDYPWGWTFVSGYPWGWYPFFYGNWFFISGYGWCWHPGGPRFGPHGPGPHFPRGGLGSGFHSQPSIAGATPHGFTAPHPPAHLTHGSVAIAGSNLRVGPIEQTHASAMPAAASGFAHGVPSSGPPAARTGITSASVHANPASGQRGAAWMGHDDPGIVGGKGNYRVSNPTAGGRTVFDSRHPPSFAAHPGGGYSGGGRSYAYNGSAMPHSFNGGASMPHGMTAPSSSAPHYSGGSSATHSGGSFSGGGFHSGGGGFSGGGGGGFHGGGGGGGGHR